MNQPTQSTLTDRPDRYGWLSILLHWTSAAAVIALWIIGKGIDFADADAIDQQRALHMSIGVSVWLLLAVRIGWRIRSGHPRAAGLTDRTFRVAMYAHYATLVAIALMLVSGPVMVWANDASIPVFGAFEIPGPVGASPTLRAAARTTHVVAANVILLLTLAHIAGALKHLMFHADESFVRMLWPGRSDRQSGS